METDTICTEEQPCKQAGCGYCDPFGVRSVDIEQAHRKDAAVTAARQSGQPDGNSMIFTPSSVVPLVNSPGLQAFAAPPPSAIENLSDQSDEWNKPPPSVSPIPSLDDTYREMKRLYTEYEGKVAGLALAENTATEDRIALEQARADVLLKYTDPKELGGNEAQRTSAINFHCDLHIKKLQAGQRSVELLKCEVEVARLRCRMADNTLRFCEAQRMDGEYSE